MWWWLSNFSAWKINPLGCCQPPAHIQTEWREKENKNNMKNVQINAHFCVHTPMHAYEYIKIKSAQPGEKKM